MIGSYATLTRHVKSMPRKHMAVSHLLLCKIYSLQQEPTKAPKWANIPFGGKRLRRGFLLCEGLSYVLRCGDKTSEKQARHDTQC